MYNELSARSSQPANSGASQTLKKKLYIIFMLNKSFKNSKNYHRVSIKM